MQSTWVRPRPGRTGYLRDLYAAIGMAVGYGFSAASTRGSVSTRSRPSCG